MGFGFSVEEEDDNNNNYEFESFDLKPIYQLRYDLACKLSFREPDIIMKKIAKASRDRKFNGINVENFIEENEGLVLTAFQRILDRQEHFIDE